MNKRYFMLLMVFLLTLALAACTDDSNVEEGADGSADGENTSEDSEA